MSNVETRAKLVHKPILVGPRRWDSLQLSSYFVLLTKFIIQIGFAAADAITGLKLIEEGVPKEHLAMMAVPMVPIDIILPIIITRYSSSSRPLDILLKGMPFRFALPNHFPSSPFSHESVVG